MSSEYSVEEVLKHANLQNYVMDETARAIKTKSMLTAYAERIKADERAVSVTAEVVAIVRQTDIGDKYLDWTIEGSLDALEVGDAVYCIGDIAAPEDGAIELFTHPPAQAAQVDDELLAILDADAVDIDKVREVIAELRDMTDQPSVMLISEFRELGDKLEAAIKVSG